MGMGNSDGMNSINDMSYGDNSLILKCQRNSIDKQLNNTKKNNSYKQLILPK